MNLALTYFRVSTIIGPNCLTAVFGMGTGVSSQVWAPEMRFLPPAALLLGKHILDVNEESPSSRSGSVRNHVREVNLR